MEGTANTLCSARDTDHVWCDESRKVWSSKGGFSIKDMKCEGIKCVIIIETDNIQYSVRVSCTEEFDTESGVEFFKVENKSCKFRRNFELHLDGRVEYKN